MNIGSFLRRVVVLVLGAVVVNSLSTPSQAQISDTYLPNYGLNTVIERIMHNFTTIISEKKAGNAVNSSIFYELYNDFQSAFPQLPQRNDYKIVYNICLIKAQSLSTDYSHLDLDIFLDQCYNPLNAIIKEINANFTIKAAAKASPSAGSAPLTVTLDARASTDPSNDTIPSNNFYRYYKNSQGVDTIIGQGAVVNYKFLTAGNYHVHLTAKSANKQSKGILDGEATVLVNVTPEAANIVAYLNGKKLKEKSYTKIGTTEASRGVIIDGSATQPKGGRTILSYSWRIAGDKGFSYYSDTIAGAPGSISMKFPENGAYTITLSTLDNENNTTEKSFLVAVSDPIALIKQSPELVTTSTDVSFDASASYSINSRVKKYSREIYNESGDKELVSQQKFIQHNFKKPGNYTIKLVVTDELGNTDSLTELLAVQSTPPQAQFTITPRLDWEFPSQFVLDASSSFDRDVKEGYDALSYEWNFNNPSSTKIEQSYEEGKSLVVSFDELGKHTITLKVSDKYGKTSTLSREIDIQSSLRPVILLNPKATSRGQSVKLMVTSNKDILNYSWNFGDGSQQMLQQPTATHVYKKSGVYNVKLTTTDKKGDQNSISTLVFIGDKDVPIGAYSVLNSRNNILRADQSCGEENNPAYLIRRGEQFSIDVSSSVNTQGQKQGLKFYFTPEHDEVYTSNGFSYAFKERVGCQKIDLLVEDTNLSKTDKQTIWFYVINSLPTIDSLGMLFPQFGNESGIGFGQMAQQSSTFNPLLYNPLVVKVSANSARDADGTISQFVWYYYKADDPTNILDMKFTPGNVPYAFFSLYTNDPSFGGGDIVFGVKMIDNDGGERKSEDIIGQGPGFFIPPCTTEGICDQNLDTPVVTLSLNKTDIAVGDKVKFIVNAKILSNRSNFASQRIVRYDFDGDGVWDKVTKSLEEEYTFTKPAESIIPRVEVTYRKNTVSVAGPDVSVQQRLQVSFAPAIVDKTVYLRDYSMGDIFERKVCFEHTRSCVTSKDDTLLSHTYESYGDKSIIYTIYDKFGNKALGQMTISLKQPDQQELFTLASIPSAEITGGHYVIPVGSQQGNKVFLNGVYLGTGECYFDLDIASDSDFDSNLSNDQDLACNTPQYVELDDLNDELQARIIYQNENGQRIGNDIIFNFIDKQISLKPEQQEAYHNLQKLISSLPADNDDQSYIKTLLKEMAENIKLAKDQTETILNLRVFLENSKAGLSEEQLSHITTTIKEYETSDSIALAGGNVVDQVRQFLIDYSPSILMKSQIKQAFSVIQQLPEAAAQPEIVKTQLEQVIKIFQENSVPLTDIQKPGNEEKIISSDIETQIIPRICEVLDFYDISSELCAQSPEEGQILTPKPVKKKTVMGTILKRVGIVVGSLGLIFVLIVAFFAVKSRLQQLEDQGTSSNQDTPPSEGDPADQPPKIVEKLPEEETPPPTA